VYQRLLVLLSLSLAMGLAVPGGATTYTHPTNGQPPTPADLVMIGGNAHTLAVRILNLLPYVIDQNTQSSAITACNKVETDRHTHDPCMYAPLGWPSGMPALEGSWGQDQLGTWVFTPTSPNTKVHPYNFVLTFNDQGDYQDTGTMGWTIRHVWNEAHASQGDVELRLWITRTKPIEKLRSEIFRVIEAAFVELVDLLGLALEPENPIAWFDAFVATKELGSSSFEASNAEETGGEKMYAAAYVVPDGLDSSSKPEVTTHSSSDETTDAVDVQWGSSGGHYQENIMVTTHLLRGEDTSLCCGSAPILSITLWTPEMYTWAMAACGKSPLTRDPGGRQINSLLRRNTKEGYKLFAHLYRSLDEGQRQSYRASWQSLLHHKRLTAEQGRLLEQIAQALEKRQTSLSGKEETHEHERPQHHPHNG
jgi:hypothetical protein